MGKHEALFRISGIKFDVDGTEKNTFLNSNYLREREPLTLKELNQTKISKSKVHIERNLKFTNPSA